MMGSSAPAPPPNVALLAMVHELLDVLKNSEQAVADHLADLRSVQAEADNAMAALVVAQTEHAARQAKLDALAEKLQGVSMTLADREFKHTSESKDLAAREAALEAQSAQLTALSDDVSRREETVGKAEAEQTERQAAAETAQKLERSKVSNEAATARRLAMQDADNIRRAASDEAARMLDEARAELEEHRGALMRDIAEERRQAKAEHDAREKIVVDRERTLAEAQTALRAAMAA